MKSSLMGSNWVWMGILLVSLVSISCGVETAFAADDTKLSVWVNPPASDSKPKTLRDAFLAAVKMSETVGIQQEMLVQANEVNSQATGALFPTISGAATFLAQQDPTNSTGASLYPSSQNTVKITADQPIFRGFRDFAALRQKKDAVGAQAFALQTAARTLFYNLAISYYTLLALQKDEKNYQIEIEVNQKRLTELEGFFKIGRSQLTDVLTFKSNISALEAQIESTRNLLENQRETLAFLTGWKRDMVLQDDENVPSKPEPIENYLSKIENRDDVQAAVKNVQLNEEGIPIAWGAHLPSADVIADYYITRPGALSNVNWDVSLSITVPIFQGGIVQSQVRQAASVARQFALTLSQTRRTAEQEIRQFYDTWVYDTRQMTKLADLVDVSKKNSETEIKYYRNGLVTNLDVLTAITTYQDAQRQLDHQKDTVVMDHVKLLAATGQRPEVKISTDPEPTNINTAEIQKAPTRN